MEHYQDDLFSITGYYDNHNDELTRYHEEEVRRRDIAKEAGEVALVAAEIEKKVDPKEAFRRSYDAAKKAFEMVSIKDRVCDQTSKEELEKAYSAANSAYDAIKKAYPGIEQQEEEYGDAWDRASDGGYEPPRRPEHLEKRLDIVYWMVELSSQINSPES